MRCRIDSGPAPLDIGGPVTKIASAHYSHCALMQTGNVRCWGRGYGGQLGYGNTQDVGDEPGEMPPPDLQLGGTAIDVQAAADAYCALMQSGEVRCWGYAGGSVLGHGDTESKGDDPGEMPPPVTNVGGAVTQLALSYYHACAVLESGELRCWGQSEGGWSYGIGNGSIGNVPGEMPPANVDYGGGVIDELDLTVLMTCVRVAGTLRCWGSGSEGKLGNGSVASVAAPGTEVAYGAGTIVQVENAGEFGRIRLQDGTIRAWGYNAWGQLGYGHAESLGDAPGEMPTADIDVGGTVVMLSSGRASGHSCALLDDGTVRCWGSGADGRLGNGSTENIGDNFGEMPPDPVQLY